MGTGPVGDNLEAYLLSGHDADLDLTLAALQPPEYIAFDLRPDGRLVEHFTKQRRIQFGKVLRVRHYQVSGHIGAAGGHGEMVRSFTVEMMGAMAVAKHHHRAVFRPVVPDEEVELRLLLPFRNRDALEQAVEEFAHGLGSPAAQREDSPHEMPVVVHHRLLYTREVLQFPWNVEMYVLQSLLTDAVKEAVHNSLQR